MIENDLGDIVGDGELWRQQGVDGYVMSYMMCDQAVMEEELDVKELEDRERIV